MESQTVYNTRSPAVKRLMREAAELKEPADEYYVQPLEDNLFEWHFTINGPPSTEFEGGIYHGRIVLPTEYPMKPPNIIILTPNGRFETNKNICLSISGHHPETWQPSWSIRTALLALIAFMPTPGNGMIGALDYTVEERKTLARRSRSWQCPVCGEVSSLLNRRCKDVTSEKRDSNNKENMEEAKEDAGSGSTMAEKDECYLACREDSDHCNQQKNISHLAGENNEARPSVVSEVVNYRRHNGDFLKNYVLLSFIILLISLLVFRRIFLL